MASTSGGCWRATILRPRLTGWWAPGPLSKYPGVQEFIWRQLPDPCAYRRYAYLAPHVQHTPAATWRGADRHSVRCAVAARGRPAVSGHGYWHRHDGLDHAGTAGAAPPRAPWRL